MTPPTLAAASYTVPAFEEDTNTRKDILGMNVSLGASRSTKRAAPP